MEQRKVYSGVSQKSILGPLLWNFSYNTTAATNLSNGVSLTYYTDNTLVLAVREDWKRAIQPSEDGTWRIVDRIWEIGLEMALHKMEVLAIQHLRESHLLPPDPVGENSQLSGLIPSQFAEPERLDLPPLREHGSLGGPIWGPRMGGNRPAGATPAGLSWKAVVSPAGGGWFWWDGMWKSSDARTDNLGCCGGSSGWPNRYLARRLSRLYDYSCWSDSGYDSLTYCMMQVLSRHGCFGQYLRRIDKKTTVRS
ncbi:uncharacterized protein LOC143143607 [Ptiloglossa arizonensis]|uniref:uncharacterized protein LOC143143607 n=1 Tax=Ptiloglossa arizonensis TaxID=3350558 RepID=UPI003FA1487E